jgi:Tol biopolymer transport system component
MQRTSLTLAAVLMLSACGDSGSVVLGPPVESVVSTQPPASGDGVSFDAPAWSPDGSSIAFHSLRDGNYDIYVMDADGSNEIRLTTDGSADLNPVWSPDGLRIAFVSTRDADYELYVMNADGSDQQRLTESGGRDEHPTWSPDGSRIAFSSDRDGRRELFVMDADGTNLERLGEVLQAAGG